ncbi:hypothetical protein DFS34DRAFT_653252 [Phlyctochytrium arcticum]|nr:hypothetical protein DFS34DRAFT_653252 [Phlyctochytrium arcticum]
MHHPFHHPHLSGDSLSGLPSSPERAPASPVDSLSGGIRLTKSGNLNSARRPSALGNRLQIEENHDGGKRYAIREGHRIRNRETSSDRVSEPSPPTASSHHSHGGGRRDISSMSSAKPKRVQVKNACVNCQKACKKCDEARPCSRCVKFSIQDSCRDSERKERNRVGLKRGAYKRKSAEAYDEFHDSPMIRSHTARILEAGYAKDPSKHHLLSSNGLRSAMSSSLYATSPQLAMAAEFDPRAGGLVTSGAPPYHHIYIGPASSGVALDSNGSSGGDLSSQESLRGRESYESDGNDFDLDPCDETTGSRSPSPAQSERDWNKLHVLSSLCSAVLVNKSEDGQSSEKQTDQKNRRSNDRRQSIRSQKRYKTENEQNELDHKHQDLKVSYGSRHESSQTRHSRFATGSHKLLRAVPMSQSSIFYDHVSAAEPDSPTELGEPSMPTFSSSPTIESSMPGLPPLTPPSAAALPVCSCYSDPVTLSMDGNDASEARSRRSPCLLHNATQSHPQHPFEDPLLESTLDISGHEPSLHSGSSSQENHSRVTEMEECSAPLDDALLTHSTELEGMYSPYIPMRTHVVNVEDCFSEYSSLRNFDPADPNSFAEAEGGGKALGLTHHPLDSPRQMQKFMDLDADVVADMVPVSPTALSRSRKRPKHLVKLVSPRHKLDGHRRNKSKSKRNRGLRISTGAMGSPSFKSSHAAGRASPVDAIAHLPLKSPESYFHSPKVSSSSASHIPHARYITSRPHYMSPVMANTKTGRSETGVSQSGNDSAISPIIPLSSSLATPPGLHHGPPMSPHQHLAGQTPHQTPPHASPTAAYHHHHSLHGLSRLHHHSPPVPSSHHPLLLPHTHHPLPMRSYPHGPYMRRAPWQVLSEVGNNVGNAGDGELAEGYDEATVLMNRYTEVGDAVEDGEGEGAGASKPAGPQNRTSASQLTSSVSTQSTSAPSASLAALISSCPPLPSSRSISSGLSTSLPTSSLPASYASLLSTSTSFPSPISPDSSFLSSGPSSSSSPHHPVPYKSEALRIIHSLTAKSKTLTARAGALFPSSSTVPPYSTSLLGTSSAPPLGLDRHKPFLATSAASSEETGEPRKKMEWERDEWLGLVGFNISD